MTYNVFAGTLNVGLSMYPGPMNGTSGNQYWYALMRLLRLRLRLGLGCLTVQDFDREMTSCSLSVIYVCSWQFSIKINTSSDLE